MGCSHSNNVTGKPYADTITVYIDNQLKWLNKQERWKKRIVLLGTELSGKSTIYKQIDCIYNDDQHFNLDKYSYLVDDIRNQCISVILNFCASINDQENIERIKDNESKCNLKELGNIIIHIWSMNTQKIILNNKNNNINSISYFLDKIQDIMDTNYILTQQDILNHHHKFHSTLEMEFEIKETAFHIIDINYKQFQYRKMYLFDGFTAIIFVAALSGYSTNNEKNMNEMK
eukprot:289890_1